MKKVISIVLAVALAGSFLLIDTKKAEAMNNESAAMLAGAIAIFGKPVLQTVAREIMPASPAYAEYYGDSYPRHTRVTEREVIYVKPDRYYYYDYPPRSRAYERGWRDERRHDYWRGRHDARWEHRHDRHCDH